MRQLSIIYLVSGAVLLVGVLLISMSPDHRQALSALQNPGAVTLHPAGHLPLYFMPHRGGPTEKTVFYAQTSHYTMWTTSEGLVFDRGGTAAAGEENQSPGNHLGKSNSI